MQVRSEISQRPVRSIADLRSDSKTLRYELDMLIQTAMRYSAPVVQADVTSQNARVESFAIHCRALTYFLFGHLDEIDSGNQREGFAKPRPTDVLAQDFDPQWTTNCPQPTPALVQAKWQADKHVAHITTDRREVNQPGSAVESVWNLDEAVRAICSVMDKFLSSVPSTNIEPVELSRMKGLLTPWMTPPSPPSLMSSFVPPAVSHAPNPASSAKSDARTISPHRPFGMHGRTE